MFANFVKFYNKVRGDTTDKLYTRKRIRIPQIKKKKISRVKAFIFFIFICLVCIIGSFLYAAFPIFKASCESAAGSLATNITNESVMEVMQNYTYNDLMHIQKDGNEKVNFLEANIVTVNQAITEIISKIQKRIDAAPRTKVYINMGSVSGVSDLKAVGPQFDIELETAGRIVSNVRTEFENVGINQTLHKIFLDLNTNIGILTPYGSFTRNFETTVLLAQAIIVGEVPGTYYDFDGIQDSGEAYEMID